MPLKHLTETVLVAALAVAVILTGMLLPTLPPLPQGILPWLILFFLTLAYPLSLYGMLRRNRADYSFRVLHFLPAILAAFWLVLQLLMLRVPGIGSILRGYLYAWTLPGVALSFMFLMAFILHVIRRRETRLTILAILFLPFLFLSTVSERTGDGTGAIASVIWQGDWWDITGSASSSRSGEVAMQSSSVSLSRASTPVAASSRSSAVPFFSQGSSSSKPPRLPSAGLGLDLLAVTLAALYMGTVHRRAKNRT